MPYVVFKLVESSAYVDVLRGDAKEANFLKIGNFERPSLTHRTSYGHHIFSLAQQLGALVVCQVLSHSLLNWGDIVC